LTTANTTRPAWLRTAVFCRIHPQSFADSNGGTIGEEISTRADGLSADLCHPSYLGHPLMCGSFFNLPNS
jgi:hypothetical protein